MPPSTRAALVARLREQLPEIEADIYTEVRSVSPDAGSQDPEYLAGLRAAVAEAIDFGLTGIEHGCEASSTPIPLAALAQARRAARSGVELGTVLLRYTTGERVLGDFIVNEAERFPVQVLQQMLKEQGSRVGRLTAAASREYGQEREKRRRSPGALRSDRIKRLLANDGAVKPDGLDYTFDAWHLGLIARGADAEATVRELASGIDREALSSAEGDEVVWAWLGGRRPLAVADVERFLIASSSAEVEVALGEPRAGLDGWRLTHREARAGFAIMLRRPRRLTRGSDVSLLAAMLGNPPLAESLLETFLRPWAGHDNGAALRTTLRTYLGAGLNAESTSKLLQIDRSTVHRHLHKVEETLKRPVHECHAELKVALELQELRGDPREETSSASRSGQAALSRAFFRRSE